MRRWLAEDTEWFKISKTSRERSPKRCWWGQCPQQLSAKINCLRPQKLCQVSVPGMSLITVWCSTNNGLRSRTEPLSRHWQNCGTAVDLSSSGWTQSKSFVGFCRCPKIFCSSCSGLFTEGKALGGFSSCTRNVRRMMRQSLIVELIQSTANISETPKAGFLLYTTDREADWIIILVKVYWRTLRKTNCSKIWS